MLTGVARQPRPFVLSERIRVLQIYLPIAELSMNLFFLVGIGGAVGFLSGLFGVGGGFLLTPLLIFSGVPAPVAVASVTGQVVAASTSGALSYYRRGGIDLHLAMYLVLSGVLGAFGGRRDLSAAARRRPARSRHFARLPGPARLRRHADADRGGPRACCKRRAGIVVREQAARPAQLDPRPAHARPVQEVAALYQRAAGAGDRRCSSALSARCWASAAASSWCRRWSICCACRATW